MVDSTVLEDLDVKLVSMLDQELRIPMEDPFANFQNHLLHNVLILHAVEQMKIQTQQLD